MISSIAFLGSVPDSIRAALRAAGHDVQDGQPSAGDRSVVVVAHARGDWPTFAKGTLVVAICDTPEAAASAYRAGAYFAAPPDPSVVVQLVERACSVFEGTRAAEAIRSSTLAKLEREAILSAMKASAGSTARAAAMLDISVRKVQYKLHEYGVPLTRKSQKTEDPSNGS